jgi:hypothetical protein
MEYPLMRTIRLGAFAALCAGAVGLGLVAADAAPKLDTAAFIAACIDDPAISDDPGFEEANTTPKAFCTCVAGKLEENKLSQTDVEMLTKLHNEAITDEDAETYPTLEDLLVANEAYEDACRQSLGITTDYGSDIEEVPMNEGEMPDGEAPVPDDGPAPE